MRHSQPQGIELVERIYELDGQINAHLAEGTNSVVRFTLLRDDLTRTYERLKAVNTEFADEVYDFFDSALDTAAQGLERSYAADEDAFTKLESAYQPRDDDVGSSNVAESGPPGYETTAVVSVPSGVPQTDGAERTQVIQLPRRRWSPTAVAYAALGTILVAGTAAALTLLPGKATIDANVPQATTGSTYTGTSQDEESNLETAPRVASTDDTVSLDAKVRTADVQATNDDAGRSQETVSVPYDNFPIGYEVRDGDTAESIAEKFYGDAEKADFVVAGAKGKNWGNPWQAGTRGNTRSSKGAWTKLKDYVLRAGEVITLPSKRTVRASTVFHPGDSPGSKMEELCGDGSTGYAGGYRSLIGKWKANIKRDTGRSMPYPGDVVEVPQECQDAGLKQRVRSAYRTGASAVKQVASTARNSAATAATYAFERAGDFFRMRKAPSRVSTRGPITAEPTQVRIDFEPGAEMDSTLTRANGAIAYVDGAGNTTVQRFTYTPSDEARNDSPGSLRKRIFGALDRWRGKQRVKSAREANSGHMSRHASKAGKKRKENGTAKRRRKAAQRRALAQR